jgi:hypothetical protein
MKYAGMAGLRWLMCGCLLTLSAISGAEGTLRLGVSQSTVGFTGYAKYTEGQPMQGALIDFWRCVLAPEPQSLEFVLRPFFRTQHEMEQGELDIHISTFHAAGVAPDLYTDAFLSIYISIISLAEHNGLLADGVWQQQGVGVVQRSSYHSYLEAQGVTIGARVPNMDKLLTLLVRGRLSVVSLPLTWPAEDTQRFMGAPLASRGLLEKTLHGAVSPQRHALDPQLIDRINQRMPACQTVLAPVRRNLLQ